MYIIITKHWRFSSSCKNNRNPLVTYDVRQLLFELHENSLEFQTITLKTGNKKTASLIYFKTTTYSNLSSKLISCSRGDVSAYP